MDCALQVLNIEDVHRYLIVAECGVIERSSGYVERIAADTRFLRPTHGIGAIDQPAVKICLSVPEDTVSG
jgi:hypothetical protein